MHAKNKINAIFAISKYSIVTSGCQMEQSKTPMILPEILLLHEFLPCYKSSTYVLKNIWKTEQNVFF